MQKHDFEKQVKEKMEELSLVPAAPVWQKIEAQIKRKREKRRIVFWLLPLLLMAVGAGSYLFYHPASTTGDKADVAHSSSIQPPADIASKESSPVDQPGQAYKQDKTIGANKTTATTAFQKNNLTKNKPVPFSHMGAVASLSTDRKPVQLTVRHTTDAAEQEQSASADNSMAFTAAQIKETVATIPYSFTTDSLLQLRNAALLPARFDSSAYHFAQTDDRRWQWSIDASAGTSLLAKNVLGAFDFNKSADLYANPNLYGNGSQLNNYAAPPSPVTEGVSFAVGVGLKKKISSRIRISTGIQYAYYSMNSHTGQKVQNLLGVSRLDASSNAYFNSNRFYQYNNQYHFIEWPVGIGYQLLKRKSLYISTGVSFTRLLASNALYYDPHTNFYYRDERYLSKTGINYMAGLTYQFSIFKHVALSAGPQLQYGLRSLQKSNASSQQHLFAAGLHLDVSLK